MLEPIFQLPSSHGCKVADWIPAIIAMIIAEKKRRKGIEENTDQQSIPRNAY